MAKTEHTEWFMNNPEESNGSSHEYMSLDRLAQLPNKA